MVTMISMSNEDTYRWGKICYQETYTVPVIRDRVDRNPKAKNIKFKNSNYTPP